MTLIRSVLFTAWLYGAIGVVGIVGLPLAALSRRTARAVAVAWAATVMFGARWIAGIRFRVTGTGHLPAEPALIAMKHMSMMETVAAFLFIRPTPAFVLKQELLKMPVFGWYCRRAGMIAIDRDGHMKALKQMVADAREKVAEGRSIIIFPEGTRQDPGAPPDYKPGVAAIYGQLGLPCVPVALDTGVVWPGQGIRKTPGEATFAILPPIEPGLKRGPFMERLQGAIEPATAALLAAHGQR